MKRFFILVVFFLFAKFGMAQTTTTTTTATTIPQFNSAQEKEAWIKAHPAEYQRMLNASAANAQTPAPGQATVDPTFPQYVNTGNKEKDDADYKAAKEAWIKANPAKYAQMTGQPK
ncbi:MAG TPA: hypothetical protein VFJ43_10570 [Bacteroidia bacterium]|nr:hypothetical protein [Bacteroidia bacterium]